MKNKAVHQEILLIATSAYCKQTNAAHKSTNRHNTNTEQLEDACYNGLLNAMLPEIIEKSAKGKKLLIWNIRHGQDYLQIGLSEFSMHIINRFSIDPDYFLGGVCQN